jgi:hypothetical protein
MVSANESFLRTLVGTPLNRDKFPARSSQRSKKCKAPHVQNMCMGQDNPEFLGAWRDQCTNAGVKCEPVYYGQLDKTTRDEYADVLENFNVINRAADNLTSAVDRIQKYTTILAKSSRVHDAGQDKIGTFTPFTCIQFLTWRP